MVVSAGEDLQSMFEKRQEFSSISRQTAFLKEIIQINGGFINENSDLSYYKLLCSNLMVLGRFERCPECNATAFCYV
jgi:hypothetical protein